MTKIDIISGFLGAGKTTFIKKLLEEAISGEEVVLIENEFGEIGIDSGFLKDAGVEIREMNSGCICCSLVGDFEKSLKELLTKYHPDRVMIEPSGVGKLSDVLKAVQDVSADLEVTLGSAVTIVDANKCRMYMKNFGEFFNNQIEHAGTIVLSRTDIADPAKIDQDIILIRERNKEAALITTPLEQLTGKQLLELIENRENLMQDLTQLVRDDIEEKHHHHDKTCRCGHDHHHEHEEACGCGHDHDHHHGETCGCGHDHNHHADEVFTSWGVEHAAPCRKETLEEILEELAYGNHYGDVLRAKGMLPSENAGEWLYFDLVPEQYEIRTGTPDYTGRVCVIGAKLNEHELAQAFISN